MIKVIGILLALAVVCQCDSSAVPVLFYEKNMRNSDNTVTVGKPLISADFTAMFTTFKGDVDVILVDEVNENTKLMINYCTRVIAVLVLLYWEIML
jgi:hypothetical protein